MSFSVKDTFRPRQEPASVSKEVDTVSTSTQQMAISEDTSRCKSSSSMYSSSSRGSIRGWGSASTRHSYKLGLSELVPDETRSSSGSKSFLPATSDQVSDQEPMDLVEDTTTVDSWGYYVDTSMR
uniref:Uncharacterized protein n=1 Tax=Trieres chinensis TaxID=1514140 RepID=A0A7S1ZB87_TRICV|eukprot:CAMPEP_0183309604 /NCGR_PEP_ID=MMETSP0160_2-20130417/25441_1 /TAXON_ID=2839 ORGANISM="Odontella Sinensis, Strain Grunow 1884" /NCGR_SAMPLE_ID=MMETSP0160_2 /ASSEMBLY_ACC=CAM_ASM_000250 /LENGTH=124 /DNA_ID=CAMNT_0025473659 /DNA_START=138 /DNA_END=512 /DNA_ORIENTATION=+